MNGTQEWCIILLLIWHAINNLHSPQSKNSVKCNNPATALAFFTCAFTIALLYADYLDLYAARMMRYGRHVKYGNDHMTSLIWLSTQIYVYLSMESPSYKCTSILSKGYKIPRGTEYRRGDWLNMPVLWCDSSTCAVQYDGVVNGRSHSFSLPVQVPVVWRCYVVATRYRLLVQYLVPCFSCPFLVTCPAVSKSFRIQIYRSTFQSNRSMSYQGLEKWYHLPYWDSKLHVVLYSVPSMNRSTVLYSLCSRSIIYTILYTFLEL